MKRLVRILGVAMVLCMLFTVVSFASTGKYNEKITYRTIGIVVNGSEISPCDVNGNSTEPFIRNADNSTYLPVRAVAGALGLDVDWIEATNTVVLKSDGTVKTGTNKPVKSNKEITASLYYRDIVITLDGKAVDLKNAKGEPVEPFIKDGTTYIPVRAVATALGCEVGWDGDTNTVTIDKKGSEQPVGTELSATLSRIDSLTLKTGDTFNLRANAKGGKAPYVYNWCILEGSTWKIIEKGSSNTYTIVGDTEGDFTYKCFVQDATGKTVSTNALDVKVAVNPIIINSWTGDISVSYDETATLTVEVKGGTPPYSYKWEVLNPEGGAKWTAVSAISSNTFKAAHVTEPGSQYRCTITDSEGKTAVTKPAEVNIWLEIYLMSDTEKYVKEGDWIELYVRAEGGKKPYTYKWYGASKEVTQLKPIDETLPWVNGTTTNSLKVQFLGNNIEYFLRITDADGKNIDSPLITLHSDSEFRITKEDFGTAVQDKESATGKETGFGIISTAGGKAPFTLVPQISTDGTTWTDVTKYKKTANEVNNVYVNKPYDSGISAYYRFKVTDSTGASVYTRSVYLTITK